MTGRWLAAVGGWHAARWAGSARNEQVRDDLVVELREQLPVLADDVLAAPITKFERDVPEADRDRVRAEVLTRVVADGDTA
jgi:hypothetical protein